MKKSRTQSIPPPAGVSDYAVAIHDYEAQNPGELSLRRHDVVVIRETRGEWWRGLNARGQKGWFPAVRVGPATNDQAARLDLALSRLKRKPSRNMREKGRADGDDASDSGDSRSDGGAHQSSSSSNASSLTLPQGSSGPETMVLGAEEMRELARLQAELERDSIRLEQPVAPVPDMPLSRPPLAPPARPAGAFSSSGSFPLATTPAVVVTPVVQAPPPSLSPPPTLSTPAHDAAKPDLRAAVAQARQLVSQPNRDGGAPSVIAPATVSKPATAPPPRVPPVAPSSLAASAAALSPRTNNPLSPSAHGTLSPRRGDMPVLSPRAAATLPRNMGGNSDGTAPRKASGGAPPPAVVPRVTPAATGGAPPPSVAPRQTPAAAVGDTAAKAQPPAVVPRAVLNTPPARIGAGASSPALTVPSRGAPPAVQPRAAPAAPAARKQTVNAEIAELREQIKKAGDEENFERALELRKKLDALDTARGRANTGAVDDEDDDEVAIDLHPPTRRHRSRARRRCRVWRRLVTAVHRPARHPAHHRLRT